MTQRRTRLEDQVQPGHQISVEWPKFSISNADEDNDLGPPLAQLAVDLGIKGTDADQGIAGEASTSYKGLPVSVSIIEAGATAASKGWAAAIIALGGATAVWAGVTNFWNSQPEPIRGTLVIAAAVVVAACALGVAVIMYGDVRARGQGAAAQYYARAAMASAFLSGATAVARATAGQDGVPPAEAAQQTPKEAGPCLDNIQNEIIALVLAQAADQGIQVRLEDGASTRAKKLIRSPDGGWKALPDDGKDWKPISDITSLGNGNK